MYIYMHIYIYIYIYNISIHKTQSQKPSGFKLSTNIQIHTTDCEPEQGLYKIFLRAKNMVPAMQIYEKIIM